MFPILDANQVPRSDELERSVGAFVLHFGKVEYALMRTVIEINRIIDGTTIQAKFPYSFDEMCRFLKVSERAFLDESDLPPFDKIADELIELNKIRTVLVHSYMSGSTTKAEGTWFRFERFAAVAGEKNRRQMESYNVKREFIDASLEDLKIARSWLIQLSQRLEKKTVRT